MTGLMSAFPSAATEPRDYKREAAVWYEAFSKHDPQLLGSILAKDWYETPLQNAAGAKPA